MISSYWIFLKLGWSRCSGWIGWGHRKARSWYACGSTCKYVLDASLLDMCLGFYCNIWLRRVFLQLSCLAFNNLCFLLLTQVMQLQFNLIRTTHCCGCRLMIQLGHWQEADTTIMMLLLQWSWGQEQMQHM